ncbi:MAG: hypothetical protein ACFNWZ_01835 [Candidatus Absconditicoccaceae bacterium]
MIKKCCGLIGILIGFFAINTTLADLNTIMRLHFRYGGITMTGDLGGPEENNDIWFLFSESESFLRKDIAQLLESPSQREKNLRTYLSDGSSLLNLFSYHENRIRGELQHTENQLSLCQSRMTTVNQLFSQSLKDNQENGFNQAVEGAKGARSCLAEQGVLKKSLQTLLLKIAKYRTGIDQRVTYLRNNQSLILRHYDILKPTLLSELYRIASTLRIHQE